jgi:hypothetical protein
MRRCVCTTCRLHCRGSRGQLSHCCSLLVINSKHNHHHHSPVLIAKFTLRKFRPLFVRFRFFSSWNINARGLNINFRPIAPTLAASGSIPSFVLFLFHPFDFRGWVFQPKTFRHVPQMQPSDVKVRFGLLRMARVGPNGRVERVPRLLLQVRVAVHHPFHQRVQLRLQPLRRFDPFRTSTSTMVRFTQPVQQNVFRQFHHLHPHVVVQQLHVPVKRETQRHKDTETQRRNSEHCSQDESYYRKIHINIKHQRRRSKWPEPVF